MDNFFSANGLMFIQFNNSKNKIKEKFMQSIDFICDFFNTNQKGSSAFFSDNLLTFGKNLGFLYEPKFVELANKYCNNDDIFRTIIWRTHVLCWCASHAVHYEGDFVELGCYAGDTVNFIYDYVDFSKYNKQYFLYDIFERSSHTVPLDKHSSTLFDEVKKKFENYQGINVIKGVVPESLQDTIPEKIALMHIDLNNVHPEIESLKILFDRVSPGGVVILDDYGWISHKEQYEAEKEYMENIGYKILELPTGQGLILKR